MILDRPLALWNNLVTALAGLAVVVGTMVIPNVDLTQLVASIVTVAAAVLAVLANQATNGSLLGRSKAMARPRK
jgi:hypothetical protein